MVLRNGRSMAGVISGSGESCSTSGNGADVTSVGTSPAAATIKLHPGDPAWA